MAESIVQTSTGRYRGVHVDGVHAFLGMRYGDTSGRRFRPAVAAVPHADTADALAYGPAPLQFDSRLLPGTATSGTAALYFPHGGQQVEGRSMSEDCLTLNVWSPTVESGARLPVMVWVHGGAFRVGSSAATVTHGAALAATGRAVVVTVTHRLGIPGFLALGHELGDEFAHSGVAGITDLVLALEWVRDSIEQFGGDPGCVTLFGQSGGGGKVAALLAAPSAQGLFHRAILQSGAGDLLDDAAGRQQTERALACVGLTAREFVDAPVERLLAAQASLSATGPGPAPVADGDVVQPHERENISASVPVIAGYATHDSSFLIADSPWYATLDEAGIPDAVARVAGAVDAETLAGYRRAHPEESPQLLVSRIATDRFFGRFADDLARARAAAGEAVFRYEFAFDSLGLDGWNVPLGATHCAEVPFVFGTVDWARIAGVRPERHTLAARMADAWLSFAETGTPVLPDGSAWPRFDAVNGSVVRIDAPEWSVVEVATQH